MTDAIDVQPRLGIAAQEVYVGDGLFASFDGYSLWLRAPRENGDHVVALEPAVLDGMLAYALRIGVIDEYTMAGGSPHRKRHD